MTPLQNILAHLTFHKACKILGPDGKFFLTEGGKHFIDINEQVEFEKDSFLLYMGPSTITLSVDPEKPEQLVANCSTCSNACEHVGAALSVILEEKVLLGLAAPPPERVPVESLTEKELIEQAILDRTERAQNEKMTAKALEPKKLWTDYIVTNAQSGKNYRVALRGWERGESYCSCPDFRKNTLGTCKHILNVVAKAKKKFSKKVQNTPFENKNIAVYLRYGLEIELRIGIANWF